jgi:hypothetical protein
MWNDAKEALGCIALLGLVVVALIIKVIEALAPLIVFGFFLFVLLWFADVAYGYYAERFCISRLQRKFTARRMQLGNIRDMSREIAKSADIVELSQVAALRDRAQQEILEVSNELVSVLQSDTSALEDKLRKATQKMASRASWKSERYKRRVSELRRALQASRALLAEAEHRHADLSQEFYESGQPSRSHRSWPSSDRGFLESLGRKQRLKQYAGALQSLDPHDSAPHNTSLKRMPDGAA